jgi:hypothetical protein
MNVSLPGRQALLSASVITLAMAAAAAAVAGVPAQAASHRPPAITTQLHIPRGTLFGVAAASANSAWAVGNSGVSGFQTLVLHWNGRTWAQVTESRPVDGQLQAVSAASADSAWAVGASFNAQGQDGKSLIMHWNGKAWGRDASAPEIPGGQLNAVTATTSGVWAVGSTDRYNPLILHRVGGRWYVVPTEGAPHGYLQGVAVTGPHAAWAIGYYAPGQLDIYHPLLFRWNGAEWKAVSFPFQGAVAVLNGIAAGPSGTAWAVGVNLSTDTPICMRFNGKTWRKVPVPLPARGTGALDGVAFVPGGTAWAVGYAYAPNGHSFAWVSLRWTGTKWTPVEVPNGNDELTAMAGTSPDNAWGIGYSSTGLLILHWNGRSWSG